METSTFATIRMAIAPKSGLSKVHPAAQAARAAHRSTPTATSEATIHKNLKKYQRGIDVARRIFGSIESKPARTSAPMEGQIIAWCRRNIEPPFATGNAPQTASTIIIGAIAAATVKRRLLDQRAMSNISAR